MYLQYSNIQNYNETNWLDFYDLIGNLSHEIRTNNKNIEHLLTSTIFQVLCFAKQNNIDMNASWNRWKNKMDYKNYY